MASHAERIGELLSATHRMIRREVRQADLAIPPHAHRALRVISAEPIRPARLAEHLGITPRAVTSVLDSLAEAKLVGIEDDPSDRRAKVATITPAGTSALAKADEIRTQVIGRYLSRLGEADQERLEALLTQLTTD